MWIREFCDLPPLWPSLSEVRDQLLVVIAVTIEESQGHAAVVLSKQCILSVSYGRDSCGIGKHVCLGWNVKSLSSNSVYLITKHAASADLFE